MFLPGWSSIKTSPCNRAMPPLIQRPFLTLTLTSMSSWVQLRAKNCSPYGCRGPLACSGVMHLNPAMTQSMYDRGRAVIHRELFEDGCNVVFYRLIANLQ